MQHVEHSFYQVRLSPYFKSCPILSGSIFGGSQEEKHYLLIVMILNEHHQKRFTLVCLENIENESDPSTETASLSEAVT